MATFYLQNKGRGKAAKVVNFVAKWLNLCLSTVRIINYQSQIFSQGFQNCPQIWNWSTGDRVMTSSSTIFFKRSFLCQIATIRVRIIKYQSKIFSQGFQNCPRIWNPTIGCEVMTSFSTIFFNRSILRQIATIRLHTKNIYQRFFPQGFQNCPQIWNSSPRGRVMAL